MAKLLEMVQAAHTGWPGFFTPKMNFNIIGLVFCKNDGPGASGEHKCRTRASIILQVYIGWTINWFLDQPSQILCFRTAYLSTELEQSWFARSILLTKWHVSYIKLKAFMHTILMLSDLGMCGGGTDLKSRKNQGSEKQPFSATLTWVSFSKMPNK